MKSLKKTFWKFVLPPKVYDRFALEEALDSGRLEEALSLNRSFFCGRAGRG
jgi:hypothetical protein